MKEQQTSYPSDVTDAEWEFLVPYLTLMREDAPQREHSLRQVFNALRYVVKTGVQWRYLPSDFPPWTAVYQQGRRWLQAGVFEAVAHDLRIIDRAVRGRSESPSAMVVDSRTLQSTPESGQRAGYDGFKKRNGSKIHIAVDTLGNLLAVVVTAASEQERDHLEQLARDVQQATGGTVELAYADQGYTGDRPAEAAAEQGVELEVVRRPEASRGFVLLPRRWVVERTYGWLGRSRRLARDYERLSETLAGYHWVAFIGILLGRLALAPPI